jgi:hypothetical protein
MLALLHAYRGRASFAELARSGVAAAKAAGAPHRAALLAKVGAQGALSLRSEAIERALLAAAGAVAGGALTADDLAPLPGEGEAHATSVSDARVLGLPWPTAPDPLLSARVILAADARGILVALAFAPTESGVLVDELEVRLSGGATPVRRGVTRAQPGTAIDAPAPISVVVRGTTAIGVGVVGPTVLEATDMTPFTGPGPARPSLEALCEAKSAERAFGIVWDGRAASEMIVSRG